MRIHWEILILAFLPAIAQEVQAQSCGSAPRMDLRINEVQYATDQHPVFVNFLELSGIADASLDCFYLVSFDTDCNLRSALSLGGHSLDSSGYFIVTDDATGFNSLYGASAGVESSVVKSGDVPGGFWIVHDPTATTAGTSCTDVGGTVFDLIGFADSNGATPNTFAGEGEAVDPGITANAGGSMYRLNNQDSSDNRADFTVSCQAAASPGTGNTGPATCPRMELSPGSLEFGSSPQTVTLSNTGTVPLRVFDISVPAGFSESDNCPAQLSASDSCSINVSFAGSGQATGKMLVIANDAAANHEVTLGAPARACIFCDDFEDQDLQNWTPKKSSWTAISREASTTVSLKGDLISPDFGGCSTCTFETPVKITSGGRISLYAWYASGKDVVEIRLMQDKGKLLVKQRSGLLSAKSGKPVTILPNTVYKLKASFDGTDFHILIDDVEVTVLKAAATPRGNAMFRIKSGTGATVTGSFLEINVY